MYTFIFTIMGNSETYTMLYICYVCVESLDDLHLYVCMFLCKVSAEKKGLELETGSSAWNSISEI